jgi:hypothetical protein
VELSKEFFQLQLSFAAKVAEVTQVPLEETLLAYTTFYLSFDLGRSFDPTHPLWQEYLTGLKQVGDQAQWTYSFVQRQRTDFTANFYGCFSYAYLADEHTIRIHFVNRETTEHSALSLVRRPVREQELAEMFRAIRTMVPEAMTVRGGSWLYNLTAYCRLFPPEYVHSVQVSEDEFPYLALWGQFLTRGGNLRQPGADVFLARLRQQTTLEGLKHCFPLQVLRPACPIDHFYHCYRLNEAPERGKTYVSDSTVHVREITDQS